MLRSCGVVVQIYNLGFKDNIGGAVEYPKTQRCNKFAVGLTRVWSCCTRYSAVAHLFLPFSHSDFNTSVPSGNLTVHTLGIQCIKPWKLTLFQNTALFWPVLLVSWWILVIKLICHYPHACCSSLKSTSLLGKWYLPVLLWLHLI